MFFSHSDSLYEASENKPLMPGGRDTTLLLNIFWNFRGVSALSGTPSIAAGARSNPTPVSPAGSGEASGSHVPEGWIIRPAPLAQLLRQLLLEQPVPAQPRRDGVRGLYPASSRGTRWLKGVSPGGVLGLAWGQTQGAGLGDLSAALGTLVPLW